MYPSETEQHIYSMNSTPRNLITAFALLLGFTAASQNVVTITGTVMPCAGVVYPVHIVTNSVPPIDTTVYTGANCQYSFTFFPVATQGVVTVSTSCDGGATWNSVTGSWNPFLGTVILNLSCNSIAPCNACYTITQTQPWTVELTNCTSGGVAPYSYNWLFPDGSISSLANPIWSVGVPGDYIVCLSIMDSNGCEDLVCDSLFVDADGNVSQNPFACSACVYAEPLTNGPAGPPIPWTINAVSCSNGTLPMTFAYDWNTGETTQSITVSQSGWYFVCLTIADANGCTSTSCDSAFVDENGTVDPVEPIDCQAGFWVLQAYETDPNNPNGGVVPIPYELWVWNLSTGTSPFQFEWDFGDGTSSFDAYPTHVYGASGPYSLCLTLTDASGCNSTHCDSVSIDGDGFFEGMAPENEVRNGFTIHVVNQLPTNIEEQAFNEPRLWPNPVMDDMSLSFRSTVSGTVPVSIIDPNGRVVRHENLAFARGTNSIRLNAADLASGIYLLRIGNDANTMNIRFIKH